MMKRFLCGAMATALVVAGLSVGSVDASAATKVPKAKYTFKLNKASKKVVAVTRKGDDKSKFTAKNVRRTDLKAVEFCQKLTRRLN